MYDDERDLRSCCWLCDNTTCSWLVRHIPVPGWDAKKSNYKLQSGKIVDSYEVYFCPLFEKEVIR